MSVYEKEFRQALGAEGPFGPGKPQMPEADIDTAEIRRVLSKYFPQWRVDQILQETCPYCGCMTPREFKVYKHPKDGDCVGIYTCDHCGKRWVKGGKVHAEVW